MLKALIAAAAASLLALPAPAGTQSVHGRVTTYRHHRGHVHPSESHGASDVYVRESRPRAPTYAVPDFAWRSRSQEEGVGANLVGPGSVGNSPTGERDVSR